MRDYYCSRKFYSFKLDLEKKNIYNCCKSDPQNIDMNFFNDDTNSLFNTQKQILERRSMLKNDRIKSCEKGCWIAEDEAKWSLRLQTGSDKKTHLAPVSTPGELDLQLSGDCNLTCSYCCKEFSSAWRKDIIKHGDYNCETEDRYKLKKIDIVLEKLSQSQRENSVLHYFIKTKLIKDTKNLNRLIITGGEPFLHNNLISYIEIFKHVPDIQITTGLGLSQTRLQQVLSKISKYKNIRLMISGESLNENYEFNRYGNTYDHFETMLSVIKRHSIRHAFLTTYSNLTVLDYVKFYEKYEKIEKYLNLVYDPNFMSINVLDDESKDIIKESILRSSVKNTEISKSILWALKKTCSNEQRKNLELFVKEFSKRRSVQPSFMPNSLKKWLNLL